MACNKCEHRFTTFLSSFWGKENELVELLIQHGVLRRSIRCEKCGNKATIRIWKSGCFFKCEHGGHKPFVKSARVNTFIGDSKMSIQKVMFLCLYWLLFPPPRQAAIVDQLQCSRKTVVDWSMFNREVCVNWMIRHRKQIGGRNKIVELDDSKFGGKRFNNGRPVEGQWVFGGVERGDRSQFFLVQVEERNQETLLQVIKDWVLPGTIIISNCWKACNTLDFLEFRDKHSMEFVSTGKSGYTHMESLMKAGVPVRINAVETQCKVVKYTIPCFGKKKDHFEGYLAEHIFKHVHSKRMRMHHFLNAAAALYPPPE